MKHPKLVIFLLILLLEAIFSYVIVAAYNLSGVATYGILMIDMLIDSAVVIAFTYKLFY